MTSDFYSYGSAWQGWPGYLFYLLEWFILGRIMFLMGIGS